MSPWAAGFADRVADRDALRALVESYARAVDARESVACAALFVEEGVLCRVGDDRFTRRGRAEIISALDTLVRYESTSHVLFDQRVTFDGDDRASGEVESEGHHVWADDAGRHDKVLTIRYEDSYVRDGDGAWRISVRQLVIEAQAVHDLAE